MNLMDRCSVPRPAASIGALPRHVTLCRKTGAEKTYDGYPMTMLARCSLVGCLVLAIGACVPRKDTSAPSLEKANQEAAANAAAADPSKPQGKRHFGAHRAGGEVVASKGDLDPLKVKALGIREKECTAGTAESCYSAGKAYRDGQGALVDDRKANALFKIACDKHVADACNDLGWQLDAAKGSTEDHVGANAAYKAGCEYGSGTACGNLAISYENGQGVAVDFMMAKTLYEKGCNGKYGSACNGLGVLAESGKIGKYPTPPYKLYDKGCTLGAPESCANFGIANDQGEGIPEDARRAATLYEKSCKMGDGFGCSLLGSLYEEGRGVAEDLERAAELYKQGCDEEDAWGCDQLAALKKAPR